MGSVDTSLHPHTSGRAAKTSSAHSAPHDLKLYAGWFCPFVQRSWIVLEQKRIPYQYIEVNPYHKEESFLALNPRGLVPTLGVPLQHSGKEMKPLFESNVICEYLDEVYNDEAKYGQRLYPEDAYERAWCRIWIDFVGSRIVPAFYKMLQHTPEKAFSIEEAREELLGHIKTLTQQRDLNGPFFLGKEMSMVDICVVPWMLRLFLIDHYKPGGLGMPKADEDQGIWQRWREWVGAMEKEDSVQDTMSERQQYIDAYKRYAEDKTMSQVGQATRSGKGLP